MRTPGRLWLVPGLVSVFPAAEVGQLLHPGSCPPQKKKSVALILTSAKLLHLLLSPLKRLLTIIWNVMEPHIPAASLAFRGLVKWLATQVVRQPGTKTPEPLFVFSFPFTFFPFCSILAYGSLRMEGSGGTCSAVVPTASLASGLSVPESHSRRGNSTSSRLQLHPLIKAT